MKCTVKAFGITRDILGAREVVIDLSGSPLVRDFKTELYKRYPQLESLTSLFIAVNHAYAADDEVIREQDEIALIPPVAGG